MIFSDMLTRFLSAKFFVHISKLDYGMYLLNPLVTMFLCGFSDTSQYSHHLSAVTLSISVAVITYVLAVLFAVLFELPFSKLINEIFAKKKVH
jgi:peptidoglycan/LPS O-acetylase OafA/YrhL